MELKGHSFHIPVMGLAYTIDSPIKVGKFGISSVVSLIEDRLMEMMRAYLYKQLNEEYVPISEKQEDCRLKRMTDYLNLLNRILNKQFDELKGMAFEKGTDLVKYFEMLPEDSRLKQLYNKMLETANKEECSLLQQELKNSMEIGAIDVNIMTKLDKNNADKSGNIIENGSDALVSFRSFAESNLENATIVLSAGMNPRLFNYIERFDNFRPKSDGSFSKKICIKVSDYRSALIQGLYLAKRGIWVSEYRIESGLNCGGHTFATEGYLLGPILEEFKEKRADLEAELLSAYTKALETKGFALETNPKIMITVQGGVGTSAEHNFLLNHYKVDRVGWGSPFLLVPEAVTIDRKTLARLIEAGEDDVILSHSSPLGVRFNYLTGTTSEEERLSRIEKNKPGSPCPEKFLVSNTEFTEEPICTASLEYQKLKAEQISSSDLSEEEKARQMHILRSKECLCIGLSNAAAFTYDMELLKKLYGVTICPGPNVVYFNKEASLKEMVDHIYGRTNLLEGVDRPDLFNKELDLYVNYFSELADDLKREQTPKKVKSFEAFKAQLEKGIAYYEEMANYLKEKGVATPKFESLLSNSKNKINSLSIN